MSSHPPSWAQIHDAYLCYKVATKKVKAWLGVPAEGTCRQLLAEATLFRQSGKKASKNFSKTLKVAIRERSKVSEALKPHFKQDDVQWMNHNHFIWVLQEVYGILFSHDLEKTVSGPTQTDAAFNGFEEPPPEVFKDEEKPLPKTPLSSAQLDSKADDLEDLLDMLQNCSKVCDSILHVWKEVYESRLDYVSAAIVTNCAYRDMRSSIGAATIMRDVWGSELDSQLSELATSFGVLEGCELYQAVKNENPGMSMSTFEMQLTVGMLREQLKHQILHPAKHSVPFLKDLASHLETPKDGFKTALLFGSQLYCNMALSLLLGPTDESKRFILRYLREFIGRICSQTLNILIGSSSFDPATRLECQQLLNSMGVEVRTTSYGTDELIRTTPPAGNLDIWSLSHQLGCLHTFCIKLVIFVNLNPRSSYGFFSFIYILNAALFRAGEGVEYDIRVKSILDAQDKFVFRQKRPTSMEEMMKCIKNVIMPANVSDNSAVRKVHAKRCKAMVEDLSSSLLYILHTKNFGITNEIRQLLEKNQRAATESVYHGLAMELQHQMGQTYNGVVIDNVSSRILQSFFPSMKELNAATLTSHFRKMSKVKAKELAQKMQSEFAHYLCTDFPPLAVKLRNPRSWVDTDRWRVLQSAYVSHTRDSFRKFSDIASWEMEALKDLYGDPAVPLDRAKQNVGRTPFTEVLEQRFNVKFYCCGENSVATEGNPAGQMFQVCWDIPPDGTYALYVIAA